MAGVRGYGDEPSNFITIMVDCEGQTPWVSC